MTAGPMTITLTPATEADQAVVENLSAYYIYDLSEFTGWPCPESGRFGGCDEFFADWRAGRNHPFLLRVEGELAGFAGVRVQEDGETHEIQEFFLLRKFRHRGLGRKAAGQLFGQFPGRWEIQCLAVNAPAVCFWEAVLRAEGVAVTTGTEDSLWGPRHTYLFRWA